MVRAGPLVAVVEDEPSVRAALDRLIRSAGFGTCLYDSGEAFLAAVAEHLPDCVLLDVLLPGMNGLAVQKSLRDQRQFVPVVFLTGTANQSARDRALRAGAVAWLEKPVDDRLLFDAIRLAVTHHH